MPPLFILGEIVFEVETPGISPFQLQKYYPHDESNDFQLHGSLHFKYPR